MRKRILILMFLTLVMVIVFTACSKQKDTAESQTENGAGGKAVSEVIRVATMPNHIGLPIQYAIDNGLYVEAGLNIEMILFPTGAPINEALAAEQVDLAASGLASVFALASGDSYWLGDIIQTVDGLGVYVRSDSPILEHKGVLAGYPDVYGSNPERKREMSLYVGAIRDSFI